MKVIKKHKICDNLINEMHYNIMLTYITYFFMVTKKYFIYLLLKIYKRMKYYFIISENIKLYISLKMIKLSHRKK